MRRLALVVLAALAFPAAASAHATLESTTPSFRSELKRGPSVIRLHFDQRVKVLPGSIKVLNDAGKDFALPARVTGTNVSARVRPLKLGAYTVRWQAISADSHVVSGVWTFGVRDSRAIIQGIIASPPPNSPLLPALKQVDELRESGDPGPRVRLTVLGSIGKPLTVDTTQLAGKTTPTATYAAAIAVIVSLMFVALLLASGLLAIERSENAYSRLIRGLVSPSGLLSEKVGLSAVCAGVLTLAMAMLVSLFVHLDWARFPLWVLALAFGGLAFGALGVAIGGIAREVSTASLMAFLLSLPIAFLALVPANAVSGGLKSVLDAVSFFFPFKAALQAVNNAFSGTSPEIWGPLLHLAVLAVAFAALARLALRRFA